MSPPFTIHRLGEIAIHVRDMQAMFAFYRVVIGLTVLRPPTSGIAFFKIADGPAGHTTVLALFADGAGRPAGTDGSTRSATTDEGSSLHHLALNIDYADQEAAVAWFRDQGLAPHVQIFDWIGWRGVFVTDPDGNTVELVAYHPSLKEEAHAEHH